MIPRRFTTQSPDEFNLLTTPTRDMVPDMAKAGDGYNFHVTGLTHDERGYPNMTPADAGHAGRRLQNKILKNADKICDVSRKTRSTDADVVVVCYGITSRVAQRAIEMARAKGVKVGKFRLITAWPFPESRFANWRQGQGVCGARAEPRTDGRAKSSARPPVRPRLFWWGMPEAAFTSGRYLHAIMEAAR